MAIERAIRKEVRRLSEVYVRLQDFESVLEMAEDKADSAFEVDFLFSMRQSYEQYGNRMALSERQEEVLERIAYK